MRAPANSPVTALAQRSLARARTSLEEAAAERLQAVQDARTLEMSHQQIGDVLGVSEAAVRSYLRRHPRAES